MTLSPKQQNLIVQRLAAELAAKELTRIRPEIQNLAIATVSQAMCMTLHDKYDWTPADINKLLTDISTQLTYVLENYLTMEDIEIWCKDNDIINLL